MLNGKAFFKVLDDIAPLSISHKFIEKGNYDNSGFLVNSHENVSKVLFSLDLSCEAVKRAKRLKCDTIVTHHPAIYKPISSLSEDDENSALLLAIKNGFNVISMHINLDMANGGIDACLCQVLGGKKYKILEKFDENVGYGREFELENITLNELVKRAKNSLKTNKIIKYGSKNTRLKKGASFCGAGASEAENFVLSNTTDADVIISSDFKHNVIKTLIERGKSIVIIPHYASENYGFKIFYDKVCKSLNGKVLTEFFEDKRFL